MTDSNTTNERLSKGFKIKAGSSIAGVLIALFITLYVISMLPCPSSLSNIPIRNNDCDLSNILVLSLSLIVAAIFAIIVSWIFYEKQKIDSNRIRDIAEKEYALTSALSQVNQRISELEFEQRRLSALRTINRNFQDLVEILAVLKGTDQSWFRSLEDLDRRDSMVTNIRQVIDTTSLSHDASFNLGDVIEELCNIAMRTPDRNKITATGDDMFVSDTSDEEFDALVIRINQMIQTIRGLQGSIQERTRPNLE